MKGRWKDWPYKRNSIVYIWLFSYSLILMVPLVFVIGMQYSTRKLFMKEIQSSNQFVLERMQQELDYVWNDLEHIGIQLALNPLVNSVLTKKSQMNSVNPFTLYQLAEELQVQKSANTNIDRIYIYFKHLDLVVSNQTVLKAKAFYQTYFNDVDYEDWSQELLSTSNREYALFSSANSKYPIFGYKIPLPLTKKGESDANIFILLRSDFFDELAISMDYLAGRNFYILTPDHEVLFSTSDNIPMEWLLNQNWENEGIRSYKTNEEDWMISNILSQRKRDRIKYILATPTHMYVGQVTKINTFFVIGITSILLIGMVLTIVLIRKNYYPLRHLLEKIYQEGQVESLQVYNEYELIFRGIDKSYKEKQSLLSQLNAQKNIVKEHLIERLLKGQSMSLSIEDQMTHLGLSFVSLDFAVLSIYIENVDEEAQMDMDVSSFQQMKLIQFVVMNVISEVIQKHHYPFVTQINDLILCLINVNPDRKSSFELDIQEAFQKGQSFLQEHFQLYCTATLSNVHHDIESISIAYKEALDTLEYGFIVGKEDFMHYKSIQEEEIGEYYYPITEEQKIINCIKAGDSEQAMHIIDTILVKNHCLIHNQSFFASYLFFDISATIIKTLYELSFDQKESMIENIELAEHLNHNKTLSDFKENIAIVIEQACERIKKYNEEHTTPFGKEIKAFVQANYQNEALNISFIAEQVGYHPSYVSKLFKEDTGIGLLDFINKTRIEAAKEILKQSQRKKLEEVAIAVGYNNVRTFMRVFKNYEGITPGQYMETYSYNY